jgi:hypothetical protein
MCLVNMHCCIGCWWLIAKQPPEYGNAAMHCHGDSAVRLSLLASSSMAAFLSHVIGSWGTYLVRFSTSTSSCSCC